MRRSILVGALCFLAGATGLALAQNTAALRPEVFIARSWTWSAAQAVTPVVLTDATTISVNAALGNDFIVVLGGNRTLANPTNLKAGQTLNFFVSQDGTPPRTLAYGSQYKFPGGTAPTLTATSSALDLISCRSPTLVLLACVSILDIR